jgi:membrane protein DedA with SNARE-associated domain
LTETLIAKLGYLGISLILVLGGLGLPVPEEAPIIVAAVLSHKKAMFWPVAFGACLSGVLLGDFLVYLIGFVYGEKVMSLPLTRKFLTRARETQMQGYFHRHGFKILVLGRFAVGFRTAAYLTAGILKLPVLKLFLTDLLAASLSTSFFFLLGYAFADQIETSLNHVKYWLTAGVAGAVGAFLLYRYWKGWRTVGLRVGPKVLESLDEPLPPDDLHALSGEMRAYSPPVPAPAEPSLEAQTGPLPSGVSSAPFAPNGDTHQEPPMEPIIAPAQSPDAVGQAARPS